MSRIRSIHPGLWTDERFVEVGAFARLLLMGIWTECDDYGSFEWSPLKLKMRVLPADAVDATELLAELEKAGVVKRYEADGKAYGAVRNFCQYQRPKKPTHTHPQTEEIEEWVNITARNVRDGSEAVGDESGTGGEKCRQMKDGGGDKEKKGCSDEQPKARKRACGGVEIPDWVPEDEWSAFVDMRRAMPKVPFTVRAAKETIGDLDRLRGEGHDPAKVLLKAVKRGWRGVFGDEDTRTTAGAAKPVSVKIAEYEETARLLEERGDPETAAVYRKQIEKMRGPPAEAKAA